MTLKNWKLILLLILIEGGLIWLIHLFPDFRGHMLTITLLMCGCFGVGYYLTDWDR